MINTEDILLYLEGQASPELENKIKAWLAADSANQKSLNFYRQILDESSAVKEYRQPVISGGWAAIEPHIEESPIIYQRAWSQYILGILLVLFAGFAVWKITTPAPFIEIKTTSQTRDTVVFADGSFMFLSPNTHLRYPRQFTDPGERKIELLSGHGVLSVTPDPQRPFLIDVYPAGIKVLGTVFETSSDSIIARVSNREGLIRFFDLKDATNGVTVNEGESFAYDGRTFTDETPKPEPPPPPPPPPAGKMLSIPFIIEFMQYNYPRSVVFKPYLAQFRGRVRLEMNQSLHGMIMQLDTTAAFEYTEKNGVYYINKFQVLPGEED